MAAFDNELEQIVHELNLNRTAESAPRLSASSLEQLLGQAAERKASDVILVADSPAIFRVQGNIAAFGSAPLSPDEIQGLLAPVFT